MNNNLVHKQLLKRKQQKKNYDKTAKDLPPLQPGQAVRMRATNGFQKLGTITAVDSNPRSYIVNGHPYHRNRRDLLATKENTTTVLPSASPLCQWITISLGHSQLNLQYPTLACSSARQHHNSHGRVSKPNPKYAGYV
jgi:hypothetical protein